MMNPGHGRGPGSSCGSTSGKKPGDIVRDQFPAGLRVLIVDDDPTCLMILERMLRNCLYEVTKCNRAEIALFLLRKNKNGFDIVISDVHMPDMDGFKLLEHVGLEMDLPVIMMSVDGSKDVVLKGVTHGAVDYLIKPIRIEALKNIWQHVVRRKSSYECMPEHSGSVEEIGERQFHQKAAAGEDNADNYSTSGNEGSWKNSRKRKDEEADDQGEDKDDSSSLKKPRVVWSVELHQQFVAAVNQIGIDKAVPKKILELMNVSGLTRENVASHLQKYRLYLRRLGGACLNNSFMTTSDPNFGPVSAFSGFDLQALAVTGQLPAQSLAHFQPPALVDRRSIFSFENAKMRFGNVQPQQLMNRKQMNLLYGVPTSVEPKQLTALQSMGGRVTVQQPNSAIRAGQNSPMPQAQLQWQPRGPPMQRMMPDSGSYNTGTNPHQMASAFNGFLPDLAGNSLPLTSPPGISMSVSGSASYQEEVKSRDTRGGLSSTAVTAGFDPSYDIFDELQKQHSNKCSDWDMRNMELAYDVCQDAPAASFSVSEGLSHSSPAQRNRQNADAVVVAGDRSVLGQQHLSHMYGQSGSVRVKSEAAMFQDECDQDDLMTALLKQEGTATTDHEFDFDGYSMDNIPV